MRMEVVAADEKQKLLTALPIPPPPAPSQQQQQQQQQVQQQHHHHPHPPHPPHSHPHPHPHPQQPPQQQPPPPPQQGRPLPPSEPGIRPPPGPGPYEPTWGRPYPPYEPSNPDQRPHPPPSYSGPPPRENIHPPPHAQDMYQRSSSISGPPTRPPDPNFRPVNGDASQQPPLQGPPGPPPGDFRARLPYPAHDAHPNGSEPPSQGPLPPPHAIPMMQHQPDGMQHRQYPPQTPIPHQQPNYDANNYFISQSSGPFGHRQRRTTRAQQACDQCRARKAKCDEGRPSCSHCKDSNVQCVYKDVPPHKHERATQLVLEKLQQIADKLELVEDFGEKLDSLLKGKEPATSSSPNERMPPVESKDRATSIVKMVPPPSEQSHETPMDSASSQKLSVSTSNEDVKQEPVEADDEELSIPIEHTTAAHKLLWWPSIQKLLPEKIDDDYVMELEESRGAIRPYGRGDSEDDRLLFAGSPIMNSPSPRDEEVFTSSSPSARFGTGLEIYQGQPSFSRDPSVGGLNPMGVLDLDPETIRRHQENYIQNMHILHPFLGLATLDAMVGKFIRNYSPQKRGFSGQYMPPAPLTESSMAMHRVPKRKRSAENASQFSGVLKSPISEQPPSGAPFPVIHRSMENAIVLLVLALGAICSWKTDLPGPMQDPPPKGSLFAPLAGVSPGMGESSFQGANPLHSPTQEFSNPHARRHSVPSNPMSTETPTQNLRNMDVIPGMAYYAIASDVLGNLQGENDLPHAQACLLAALYTGQLAHPISSHGWISQAARACQVMIRPRRYDRMPDGPVKDLICFVFWTCLQLESDILAELDLPASGISRFEGRMNFPKGMFAHAIPNEIDSPVTKMMYYYSAQIHLRKVLNRVHTDLYKAEKASAGERRARWSTKIQEVLSVNLETWRTSLPAHMRWDDDDKPAEDINVARLRAKYYGARYIIHRPLLHHALHPMPNKPPAQGAPAAAESPALSVVSSAQSHVSPSIPHATHAEAMERWPSDMAPPPRVGSSQDPQPQTLKELGPKVLEACVTCIEAAMNSTTAFDGIKGRPIVTNIFGTAHAQFGNMLVLSATYTSKLSGLVDGKRLRELLDRTIDFLWQSRHISPTLRKDAEILSLIRRKLFEQSGQQPAATNTTGSFSSNDS